MIKKILTLSTVIVFLLVTQANAISPRASYSPILVFEGTTAKCSILVSGNSTSDEISVVLKLWHGNVCINTWTGQSGPNKPFALASGSTIVERGETYTLTADIIINGVSQPKVSVSESCT